MDFLSQILYLLQLLASLVATLQHLVLAFRNLFQPRQRLGIPIPKQNPPRSQPQPRRGKWSKSYLTDPKNRQLQKDLMVLLRGDIATAKRLLKYQRRSNPGRSDNWYLEKVIHDLERDRH